MEDLLSKAYYRIEENSRPRVHAPVHARSCGHYVVTAGFRDNPMKKDILELFWGVRGSVRFRIGNENFFLKPKTVFFYLPGDFHDIRVQTAPAEYYWMTIDGPHVGSLVEQFRIRRGLIPSDACPVHLFRQLEQQIRIYSIHSEYMTGAIAYQILSLAVAGPVENKPLFERFREHLERNFSDPDLNMGRIAETLNVHRSTLNRCIARVCGMTPGEYIQAFRMQEAYRMLRYSGWSVKEIAYETGFSDPNYFAKVVNRCFGKSPSAIRSSGNLSHEIPGS